MNAVITPAQVVQARIDAQSYSAEELLPEVEQFMEALAGESGRGETDLTARMAVRQMRSKGKRVRARLAVHACACFGVARSDAIAWAAAVEILHNATLIHDDVEDGDIVRRGEPTIWASFGKAQAINAGDFMLMLPFLALRDVPRSVQGALLTAVADYATRIVRGQVDEIALNEAFDADAEGFLMACAGKTGALLALPVVGAAILAGWSSSDAERFAQPFVQLGVLFQLQDDVVDIFADKGREQIGCDIAEGKVSALIVELLQRRPDLRPAVLEILGKPRLQTSAADVEQMRHWFEESGALNGVLEQIMEIHDQVLSCTILRAEPRLYSSAQKLASMAIAPIHGLLLEVES